MNEELYRLRELCVSINESPFDWRGMAQGVAKQGLHTLNDLGSAALKTGLRQIPGVAPLADQAVNGLNQGLHKKINGLFVGDEISNYLNDYNTYFDRGVLKGSNIASADQPHIQSLWYPSFMNAGYIVGFMSQDRQGNLNLVFKSKSGQIVKGPDGKPEWFEIPKQVFYSTTRANVDNQVNMYKLQWNL